MTLSALNRVLAQRVVYDGRIFRLSVVDISGGRVVIEPFVVETASTPFVNGTVTVVESGGRLRLEISDTILP